MKSIRDELTDCFSGIENESTKQADLIREIDASKEREVKFEKKAYALSVNYYTPEKIKKIADESAAILKQHDIDVDRLNEIFSDVDKVSMESIQLLYDREVKIEEMKQILESNRIASGKKKQSNSTENSGYG